MLTIAPCRELISDRFPIASFNIEIPRSRYYEVACATDPRLFHSQWMQHRTQGNFFSSRGRGLLRAPDGRTAFFLPPEQLRRFAGARRIYYALGSYGSPTGSEPQFTISPDALDRVPSIALAADFTGRGLDRSRLGIVDTPAAVYGTGAGELRWGGDDLLEAERRTSAPVSDEYDDGHSPELWRKDDGLVAQQSGYDEDIGIPRDEDEYELAQAHDDGEDWRAQYEEPADDSYGALSTEYGRRQSDEDFAPEEEDDELDRAAALDADDFVIEGEEDEYDRSEGLGAEDDTTPAEDEIEGFEDAAALYGAVGFGADDLGGVAVDEAPSEDEELHAQAAGDVSVGRDPGYQDEIEDEELLPAGGAARALDAIALDIPEKVRIIRVVAQSESGRDGYTAINPDNEYNDPKHPAYHKYHIGLSWGFIQFTQRSGALGRVLQAIKWREQRIADLPAAQRLSALFGPHTDELLRVTTDSDADRRVAAVGGSFLWEPVWTARFRAAGAVPHVTYAQNEVALADYLDPNLRFASWLGLDTPRGLAMVVDRCIHMGNVGGRSWIMRAAGPVQTQADRDNALRALGFADVRAFQRSQAPHLQEDGRWGALTHAAMTAALRALGSRSPLRVPDRDTILQRIADAAKATGFKRRVLALHENRADFSDAVTFALV